MLYNSDILQLSCQIWTMAQRTIKSQLISSSHGLRISQGYLLELFRLNGLTEEYLSTKELSDRYEALDEFYDDMDDCELVVALAMEISIRDLSQQLAERGGTISLRFWKPMIDMG